MPSWRTQVQNLPRYFSQLDMLYALDSDGVPGACDFCYMPVDFHNGSSRGYGFLNFRTAEAAAEILKAWDGARHFCSKVRAGTQSTPLFEDTPLLHKAPPKQFQPPKCNWHPPKCNWHPPKVDWRPPNLQFLYRKLSEVAHWLKSQKVAEEPYSDIIIRPQ